MSCRRLHLQLQLHLMEVQVNLHPVRDQELIYYIYYYYCIKYYTYCYIY